MGLFDSIGDAVGGVVNGLTGGVSNTNKFQANSPYSGTDFATALQQQQQLYGQQQSLAQALLAQSQGQGPNPALMQLHQTTDQNAQSAAGLLASQRGLNPALAARMASDQMTASNNAAAGHAATLSAQQQLAAQGQLGSLYGNMAGQNLHGQGLMVGAQDSANTLNAGVAKQNAGQQYATNMGFLNSLGGGISKFASSPSAAPSAGMSDPGVMGGTDGMGGMGATGGAADSGAMAMFAAHGAVVPGRANVSGDSPKNDTVPAVLSPGEIVIPRSHAQNAADAKSFIDALMKEGAKKKAGDGGFGAVLEAHRKLGEALKKAKVTA